MKNTQNYLTKKKSKEQSKLLEENLNKDINEMKMKKHNIAELTEEEKTAFKQGEKRILSEYNNKTTGESKDKEEDDISRFVI